MHSFRTIIPHHTTVQSLTIHGTTLHLLRKCVTISHTFQRTHEVFAIWPEEGRAVLTIMFGVVVYGGVST